VPMPMGLADLKNRAAQGDPSAIQMLQELGMGDPGMGGGGMPPPGGGGDPGMGGMPPPGGPPGGMPPGGAPGGMPPGGGQDPGMMMKVMQMIQGLRGGG
jgi:hypothetical protein